MTTDVSTGIMKRTQMCALNAALKERRSGRASLGAVSFNNSTLYSKETRRRLSDPAACIMHGFNLFNWVLNFLYEAWHPPHTSPSWKWIRPFSSSLNFICFTSSLCFSMSSLITRKKQARYEDRKWKTSQKSLIRRTNYFKLRRKKKKVHYKARDTLSNKWLKFCVTGLMDLRVGDLSSCFVAHPGKITALIKLSLIKGPLVLLSRLIDLICLRSTIGYDPYLVNELIDLAQVHLEESKRILTCCPFNLSCPMKLLGPGWQRTVDIPRFDLHVA